MRSLFVTFFMKCVNTQILTYSVMTGMLKVVVVVAVVVDFGVDRVVDRVVDQVVDRVVVVVVVVVDRVVGAAVVVAGQKLSASCLTSFNERHVEVMPAASSSSSTTQT